MTLEAGEGVVKRIAGEVARCRSDLNIIRRNLGTDLSPMQEQFMGQSGTAFGNMVLSWDQKCDRIVSVLDLFEAELTETDKRNNETDFLEGASLAQLERKMGAM